MLLTKTGKIRKSRGAMNNEIKRKSNKISRRKSKLTETEKLICDTLLHESKSMSAPGSLVNGLLDFSHQENMSLSRRNNVSELVNEIIDNPRKRKSDKFPLENFFREEKRSSFGLNGIRSFGNNNQISKNLLRDAGEGDCVICQKIDRYMKITLNNTAHHNVLTLNMMETITNCLNKAECDPSISAILLKNNGDHFCSGIDYSELIDCKDKQAYKAKANELCSAIRTLTETLIHFPKPIMTAVNGACLEYGVALVILSDLTFTSSKTNFQVTFTKLNLTPVGCLSYLLPKMVGPSMANAMLLLGESFRATAAYDRGLINDIYGVHSFEEDINKRIKNLAAGQTQVMEETKRILRSLDVDMLRKTCDTEMEGYSKCILSDNCQRKITQEWTATINLYSSA
ncbi:chromodomain Y-like protein 2 isoform X2 [Rhopilema esculentum]